MRRLLNHAGINIGQTWTDVTHELRPPATVAEVEAAVWLPWTMSADTVTGEELRTVTDKDVGTPGRMDPGVSSR